MSFFDNLTRIVLRRPALQEIMIKGSFPKWEIWRDLNDESWWFNLETSQYRRLVEYDLQNLFKSQISVVFKYDYIYVYTDDRNEALLFKLQQGL